MLRDTYTHAYTIQTYIQTWNSLDWYEDSSQGPYSNHWFNVEGESYLSGGLVLLEQFCHKTETNKSSEINNNKSSDINNKSCIHHF